MDLKEIKEIFSFLNAKKVIQTFSENIKLADFKQLINGYDGNKKPKEFSEFQKLEIISIIEKMANNLLLWVKEQKEKKK